MPEFAAYAFRRSICYIDIDESLEDADGVVGGLIINGLGGVGVGEGCDDLL